MKIVGLLDHPNVVRAIDADVQDNCPYIVMDYLEGDDLEKVLARRGPLPPTRSSCTWPRRHGALTMRTSEA